jgi:hypothetical protein
MTDSMEEHKLGYPSQWQNEYRKTGFVWLWRSDYPELFEDYLGSTRRGTLDLFPQYALMYLIRRDQGIHSITWYKLASRPDHSKNKERTLKYWGIMKRWMGHSNFDLLQDALHEKGFRGFAGEPDLFCWEPKTGRWFFGEAKGGDALTKTEVDWFQVCLEALGDVVSIHVYRLQPEGA